MVCCKHGKVTDAMIIKIAVSAVCSFYCKLTEDYRNIIEYTILIIL